MASVFMATLPYSPFEFRRLSPLLVATFMAFASCRYLSTMLLMLPLKIII